MKNVILLCQKGPFIFLKFVHLLKTDIKILQIEFLLKRKCRGVIEIAILLFILKSYDAAVLIN